MREIIDRLLDLERNASPGPWGDQSFYQLNGKEISNCDYALIDEMRNNIRPLLLRMKALEDVAEAAKYLYGSSREGFSEYETRISTKAIEQLDKSLNKLDGCGK